MKKTQENSKEDCNCDQALKLTEQLRISKTLLRAIKHENDELRIHLSKVVEKYNDVMDEIELHDALSRPSSTLRDLLGERHDI